MADGHSYWAGRRVLVTGGTGLIGTAAVRELVARGADVVGLVRDRPADADPFHDTHVTIVHGRAEDRFRLQSALAVHEIETVFHFATTDEPSGADRATAALLAAVGDHNPRLPVVVARPLPPLGLAANGDGMPAELPGTWGAARFGEVFGGGDRKTFRVVPATLVAHLTGDRHPHPWDAAPARDFVHAPDAARACLMLAEAVAAAPGERPTVVPFRSGWAFGDRDMAAVVKGVLTGGSTPAPSPPADRPLGWAPRGTLGDALAETAGWYREFLQKRFFGTRSAPQRRAA